MDLVTTGTHTTPINRYVDDMTFTLTQEVDLCIVDVRRRKQHYSLTIVYDRKGFSSFGRSVNAAKWLFFAKYLNHLAETVPKQDFVIH